MISIVIPCYNEGKRLGNTLDRIKGYLKEKGIAGEIIVVDDGSKDDTAKIAEKYKVRVLKNNKNRGKGYSVKKGFMGSRGEYVLFSDADLSTPIEELEEFLKLKKEYDLIFGSRKAEDSHLEVQQTSLRVLAGNIFPILVRIFLLPEIKDTQCGFKLFNRERCNKIFEKQTLDRFAFDAELLFLAKKYCLRCKEKGVHWYNDPNSKVNILRDSALMFFSIFRIRLNGLLGKYD